jgi:fimbrial chaperone protein
MLKSFNKLALVLILALPTLGYANYTITPVKVNIKQGSMMGSVTVNNNNDVDRRFQIRVYQTDATKSNITEEETKDLVVSPAMFNVAKQKGQMIRIVVKNPDAAFKQKYYVLSIKELEHNKTKDNAVTLLTDFRVPVIVGDDTETMEVDKK